MVFVNGAPLPLRNDLANWATWLGWGNGTSGARQLAVAILADHFERPEDALTFDEPFMWYVVSGLEEAHWQLDSDAIDGYLEEIYDSLRIGDRPATRRRPRSS